VVSSHKFEGSKYFAEFCSIIFNVNFEYKKNKFKNMKYLIKSLIIVSLVVSFFTTFGQNTDSNVLSVMNGIEYASFNQHLQYLASDELQGRDVASQGYNKAANYVAGEFQKYGLQPFGDNGTFFQKVDFIKPSIVVSTFKMQLKNNSKTVNGILGENVALLVNYDKPVFTENQKFVFAGYGNILPELNINDYAGIDVKGKTVLIAIGGPKGLVNKEFDDLFAKINHAKSQGAVGVILFVPSYNAVQDLIFKRIYNVTNTRTFNLADTAINFSMFDFDLKIAGFVKKDFVKEIFELNNVNLKKTIKNMEDGIFSSFEFSSALECSYQVKIEKVDCKNIVALLPGSDTELQSEYVVLGGHLDHIGIGEAVDGDSIYNGLWDNASGSSAILSIAKAFSQFTVNPKRSIIFVCFTAEEKGLLGSNFYANRNEVKDGKIAAIVNMDMIGSLFEASDIAPIGYSHSNLSQAVDYAAKTLNLTIASSEAAENDYIERSDQMSFIKTGVPALNLSHGKASTNPEIDGEKALNYWMDKVYHSPADDLKMEYSEAAFLTAIKANFLTLYYIADRMDKIEWNEESYLYKKYVLKEKVVEE